MNATLPQDGRSLHDRLAASLASYLRGLTGRMVWTELPLGAVHSARPDVITIDRSYTLRVLVYEVKASPADLRADVTSGKWHSYLTVATGVYFAMPAGMVPLSDIPKQAGVIVWRDDKGWVASRRPALQPQPELSQNVWMKLVMDGIDREVDRQVRLPGARRLNEWREAERLRKQHGDRVAQALADITRFEGRIALLATEAGRREQDARERLDRLRHEQEQHRQYEQQRVQAQLAPLYELVGLPPTAHLDALCDKLRSLRARLTTAGEVAHLTRQLDAVRAALDAAADPIGAPAQE